MGLKHGGHRHGTEGGRRKQSRITVGSTPRARTVEDPLLDARYAVKVAAMNVGRDESRVNRYKEEFTKTKNAIENSLSVSLSVSLSFSVRACVSVNQAIN